jgi:kinesin family protein 18/19
MTNAGKTYTIQGTPQNPGILPKLMDDAFRRAKTINDYHNYCFKLSILEIYQEKLYDLLGNVFMSLLHFIRNQY